MENEKELFRILGSLEEGQKNTLAYIQAVSGNQKDTQKALDAHEKDNEAHGQKSANKALLSAKDWILFAIALVAFALNFYGKDKSHKPHHIQEDK